MVKIGNQPTYVPTEEEMPLRMRLARLTTEWDWPLNIVDSIFYLDHPEATFVMRHIDKHGEEETLQLLERMDDYPMLQDRTASGLRHAAERQGCRRTSC